MLSKIFSLQIINLQFFHKIFVSKIFLSGRFWLKKFPYYKSACTGGLRNFGEISQTALANFFLNNQFFFLFRSEHKTVPPLVINVPKPYSTTLGNRDREVSTKLNINQMTDFKVNINKKKIKKRAKFKFVKFKIFFPSKINFIKFSRLYQAANISEGA